jgi:hypothetical protein
MEREDVVSLYSRIERMKEADPRYNGSFDDQIDFYMDVDIEVKKAGWSWQEYQITLFHAMGW